MRSAARKTWRFWQLPLVQGVATLIVCVFCVVAALQYTHDQGVSNEQGQKSCNRTKKISPKLYDFYVDVQSATHVNALSAADLAFYRSTIPKVCK